MIITCTACLFVCSPIVFATDPARILLWPDDALGATSNGCEEKTRVTEQGERVVSNVHKPSLTPYIPFAEKPTGDAVIIAPGGGHRELWSDHEGHNLAKWLSERGIAAFVLKYRLAKEKYKEVGVSAELHIYANAGHEFGVRDRTKRAVAKWSLRFEEWLADLKMLKRNAIRAN